jgi:hypothetical protein
MTTPERTVVWLMALVNPIATGAILYYGWRHAFPTKAKEANRISQCIFLAYVVLALASVAVKRAYN